MPVSSTLRDLSWEIGFRYPVTLVAIACLGMALSESALFLAGFVLAHSAWSISDAPELLVPLAIIERNSERRILRFEAKTQEEAIAKGKTHLAGLIDVDSWAFAREGLLNESGKKVDVISVDIWSRDSRDRITLIQRFEPFSVRKHFRLIGEPDVSLNGVIQDRAHAQMVLDAVRKGVHQHSKAGPLWENWKNVK